MAETVRPKLKVAFVDFWENFDPRNHYLARQLAKCFTLEWSDAPEVVFYSDGKSRDRDRFDAKKVYVAIEDRVPNFRECDYALTFREMDDPRNLRLPFYVVAGEGPEPLIRRDAATEARLRGERERFCAFVVFQREPPPDCPAARLLFEKLNAARAVASGGRALNNIGGPVADKDAFLRTCRFCLALENYAEPGYTTEKLYQAMAARCIPIYWGNPEVAADFNPASFINITDFASDADAVDYILRVDDDPSLQAAYHEAPFFTDNKPSRYFRDDYLLPFLEKIATEPRRPRPRLWCGDKLYDWRKRWGFHLPALSPSAKLGPRFANRDVK